MKVLKTASNDHQRFALVLEEFDDGEMLYAMKHSVGTPREKYVLKNVNDIKTWKTPAGATKAWLKLLADHKATNGV